MYIVWEGLKIPVVEMAGTRSDIASMLNNSTDRIIEHLLKLYYFRNVRQDCIDDWKTSVYNKLPSVKILKGGKTLDADFILANTWGIRKNNFASINAKFIKKFSNLYNVKRNVVQGNDKTTPYYLCSEYFKWLAHALASGKEKVTLYNLAAKKIDELLKQHYYESYFDYDVYGNYKRIYSNYWGEYDIN